MPQEFLKEYHGEQVIGQLEPGRTLFYTTSLGVVAFTIDEDQYWVLEE